MCLADSILIRADSTKRPVLAKESVDLVVTSPPYNVGKPYGPDSNDDLTYQEYMAFTKKWLTNCLYWTKNTGRLCVNVPLDKNKYGKRPVAADITTAALKAGWQYHATILWNEGNISRRTAWGSWKSASAPHVIAAAEVIVVLYKKDWKRERQGENDITAEEFKDWVRGIWEFNGENGKRIGHEAPFPLELPKRCIKLFSFINDTILDPFVGSGSTMIEAINNQRKTIGIELDKEYCKLTGKRIEEKCKVRFKKLPKAKLGKYIQDYWKL